MFFSEIKGKSLLDAVTTLRPKCVSLLYSPVLAGLFTLKPMLSIGHSDLRLIVSEPGLICLYDLNNAVNVNVSDGSVTMPPQCN